MILILSVAAFGYSQYSAITSISSTMINSQDMGAVPLGHNMQQAVRVSDYTGFMYLGKLVEFRETKKNCLLIRMMS